MSDASDLFESEALPGYRLHKLEVYNWGTFDSSDGALHAVHPKGATTLLVGRNGCGKSTLVDALLTLLVRPVVRNYNVAAGANKSERDERTYIKGAFGRLGRDDEMRAEVKYLRPDGKHYTAILACFRNNVGQAFTLAQVLHLNGEGQAEKIYCFSPGERSIADGLSKLSSERIKSQIENRGFKATGNYSEYFGWFQKQTGVRQRAMDMFNQTVAVKDVQSLDRFIRDHMLEPSRWTQKIDALQNHFRELSEAHQSLVRVRRQHELLLPVGERGKIYATKAIEVAKAVRLQAACDSFFRFQVINIVGPECKQKEIELQELERSKIGVEQEAGANGEKIRSLKNEIENAGGARLKEIPLLIKQEELQCKQKEIANSRFQTAHQALGLKTKVSDAVSFAAARAELPTIMTVMAGAKSVADEKLQTRLLERADKNRDLTEAKHELQGLEQRHGNLPEYLAEVRRQICTDLRLAEKDVPFVSELVAVKAEEREWESSIEMLLHGFALSLLVQEKYYRIVSEYVDRNKLRDSRGRGQRLVYMPVGAPRGSLINRPIPSGQSLLRKLTYKEGHLLTPWVKGAIEDRYDYNCCDTIQEFQDCQGSAVTKNRHVKAGGRRHEKDDREHASHPSRYVLGWDNLDKRRYLSSEIAELSRQVAVLDGDVDTLRKQLQLIGERELRAQELSRVTEFDDINFWRHEREIDLLRAEKISLEENNEAIRLLKSRLSEAVALETTLKERRDALVTKAYAIGQIIQQAEQLIRNSEQILREREITGVLASHRDSFSDVEKVLPEPITVENVVPLEARLKGALLEDVERARQDLLPLQGELTDSMLKYLKAFEDETDLKPSPEYLDSFLKLLEQIKRDELPQHEQRFKERLNERVTQEIGLLHGELQNERNEIESKIELLNQCLRQLDFRPGTYMRLEPKLVRDVEIVGFQESLRECINNSFDGSFEADEARYLKIEKLLTQLREEERWRDKVTDVRRWFSFIARELDRDTDAERNYFQDSAGQSGGEKAKLAFTILVAAIAYQYDIDPLRPQSDRFHFVVVDEMFSKVDDQHAEYALNLFRQFGLQLLIVAPLDAKARVTESHVGCYLQAVKDLNSSKSKIYSMTATEFENTIVNAPTTSVLVAG